jgi:nucleolar protein 56
MRFQWNLVLILVETPEEKRRRILSLAKEAVSKAYSTGEHSLAQAVNAYNEIEKSRNLLHERVEEWYGIYFPELTLGSAESYAKFVVSAGANKKQADKEALKQILGDGAEDVFAKIQKSIGGEPDANEFKAILALVNTELEMIRRENEIDTYLKENVPKLMPNISYLVDYKLAAELLSRAGSLEKLANMPSSTLQLLGAEKALFRHLRTGSKPPKYGILFRVKEVVTADRSDKGRIARLFATKLSIAARADAISKRFIGKMLKESIDKSIAKMKTRPRKPAPQRPEQQNRRFEPRWKGPRRQGQGQGGQGGRPDYKWGGQRGRK